MAAALHHTSTSWLAYQIFLPFVSIVAALVNLCLLMSIVTAVSHSACLLLLAIVAGCTPVWIPYALEITLRKQAYAHACDGFDGTVVLNAVTSNSAGLSVASFPPAFGGMKWQLFQSSTNVYQFQPVGQPSQIRIDLMNDTYSSPSKYGSFSDNPLSFPDLGLYSNGSWIRSCWAPAVNLKDTTGSAIVETGFTAYTDCSQLQVCARKTAAGPDEVYIAIARILIALESAAGCCVRSRAS
jgi:hypothetical protein